MEASYEMLAFSFQHVLSRFSGFLVASPCQRGKLQNFSFWEVSKDVVTSFRVAGVACREVLTCLKNRRKSFCVTGAILLRRLQKLSFSFGGRRSMLEVSMLILRGRRYFRRVVLRVCCESHCQGCVKWRQRATCVAGVAPCDSVILPGMRSTWCRSNCDEAAKENPGRRAARAKARPEVVKELAQYLRSQTPTRRGNSEQLLRVAAQRRWEVSQVSGVSGSFTNDEVEKAIILGSGSKRSPKSDPALEAKAGAESASGASGAWHLLVEALRAERPAEAQAAQASQAPQATAATVATWAQPAQPRDGDVTEKSHSASHRHTVTPSHQLQNGHAQDLATSCHIVQLICSLL
eukprot:s1198_g1.t1